MCCSLSYVCDTCPASNVHTAQTTALFQRSMLYVGLPGSRPIFPILLFPTVVRNLFQREENIVFSQVHVLHVSLVPFFLFPNSQLIPKGRKFCIFTGTCAACVFRPIFFYSLLRNVFQSARKTVFSQVHVLHVYFVQFFSIP